MMMKEAKPGELCKYQRVTGAGQHEYKIVLVYERTKKKKLGFDDLERVLLEKTLKMCTVLNRGGTA